MSVIYARSKNQYKVFCQTVFPSRFDKQDEDNQILDETELFNNLKPNQILVETDIGHIDIKSPLEHQIQNQYLKDSG